MITMLGPMNPSSYSNLMQGSTGKLYVPVNPNVVGYAQFDHVSGVAAARNQRGIPVNKLSILNTLIDRLLTVNGSDMKQVDPDAIQTLSDNQLDSMISHVQGQVKEALKSAAVMPYGLTGALPLTGAVFSLVV
ncbi:MAG: hypothetical protein K6F69_04475 [Treponema sp.]|nr:hypothetical protein [Treponema sp.]